MIRHTWLSQTQSSCSWLFLWLCSSSSSSSQPAFLLLSFPSASLFTCQFSPQSAAQNVHICFVLLLTVSGDSMSHSEIPACVAVKWSLHSWLAAIKSSFIQICGCFKAAVMEAGFQRRCWDCRRRQDLIIMMKKSLFLKHQSSNEPKFSSANRLRCFQETGAKSMFLLNSRILKTRAEGSITLQ